MPGLIVLTNYLPEPVFGAVLRAVDSGLQLTPESMGWGLRRRACEVNLGAVVAGCAGKVSRLVHRRLELDPATPVEYRVYGVGDWMGWHRDGVLPHMPVGDPQYECVLTLNNTSDSMFEWVDDAGRVCGLKTVPNMLVVVRGGGVKHRVTRVTRGQRGTLKFVLRGAGS
jgi:hypothetical protein